MRCYLRSWWRTVTVLQNRTKRNQYRAASTKNTKNWNCCCYRLIVGLLTTTGCRKFLTIGVITILTTQITFWARCSMRPVMVCMFIFAPTVCISLHMFFMNFLPVSGIFTRVSTLLISFPEPGSRMCPSIFRAWGCKDIRNNCKLASRSRKI